VGFILGAGWVAAPGSSSTGWGGEHAAIGHVIALAQGDFLTFRGGFFLSAGISHDAVLEVDFHTVG
jgi:hypothetical protein